eukprot:175860-Pleurochrysis_carterae.AAC.1
MDRKLSDEVRAHAGGDARGFSRKAKPASRDAFVPVDASRRRSRLEATMQHARSRQRTASVAATMAVATLKQRRHLHIRQISGARGSFCAALRVARRTLSSGCVGRQRSLEGRGMLLATCCAQAFAMARAQERAASLLQHAVSRAVSKATIATAKMAAMVMKNDAVGA